MLKIYFDWNCITHSKDDYLSILNHRDRYFDSYRWVKGPVPMNQDDCRHQRLSERYSQPRTPRLPSLAWHRDRSGKSGFLHFPQAGLYIPRNAACVPGRHIACAEAHPSATSGFRHCHTRQLVVTGLLFRGFRTAPPPRTNGASVPVHLPHSVPQTIKFKWSNLTTLEYMLDYPISF